MPIEWKSELEIGVEEIDQQHKKLFEVANNLLQACEEEKEKGEMSQRVEEKLENLFYFLVDYTVTHFADEEELQLKYNYPHYEEHKRSHQQLIDQINQLKLDFFNADQIDTELVEQITEQIREWLTGHIGKIDRNLAEYIQSNG
ncbi:bacteriohemerythrin [Natroniella sulfidigena]|uniref:bacteriohemerythrin n=1 Tax=Natroniella sulfidigena TaxID=723921 RepID=UPI00200B4340|nr:bacteriohemerythrin [Natroniella sulfidigena]MCK8816860.1 bacteriohemerythrin [Natroniella sulfidigena]